MSTSDPTTLKVTELAARYRDGSLDPAEVAEAFLAKVSPGPILRLLTVSRARAQAAAASRRWRHGHLMGPMDGVPIVVKDNVDTEGEVTGAGSPAYFGDSPANQDAPVAARLDAAGAVFLGKSTMTELAFSGLGLNPHTGDLGNAVDASRVPGGSSSGSAVAVALGWAAAAVGSDTGGSVRIPASFNGLVGLKTTDGALTTEGVVPLSTTLDTLGPIARDADDAWALWRAMSAAPVTPLAALPPARRFWAPPTVWQEGLDPGVEARFEVALAALVAAGHRVLRDPLPELAELNGIYPSFGSISSYESLTIHGERLDRFGDRMDRRVVQRIRAVTGRPATDYLRMVYERQRLQQAVAERMLGVDALLAPTVAVAPPRISDMNASDDAYHLTNGAILRNTALVNLLGLPAATVPVGVDGDGLPVGLMICTAAGEEALALGVARAVEHMRL